MSMQPAARWHGTRPLFLAWPGTTYFGPVPVRPGAPGHAWAADQARRATWPGPKIKDMPGFGPVAMAC
jgi:hypothetical protein